MAKEIEPEDLVEFIRTSANKVELFCHFDLMEVPLHEEVIK